MHEAANLLKIKGRENDFLQNEAENILKTNPLTINHIKAKDRCKMSDGEDAKLSLEKREIVEASREISASIASLRSVGFSSN